MVGWHHQIDGHMDMNKLHEIVKDNEPGVLQSMGMKSDLMTDDIQFSSVTQSCPTICDPMNLSTPGLPVHH